MKQTDNGSAARGILYVLDNLATEGRLITERELADLWKCSRKKLQHDRKARRGVRYLKIDGLVRYDPADVRKYLLSAQR